MSANWLESASWASQVAIFLAAFFTLLVAVGAAYFGFQQLRAYKLFELMKYIENEEFRTFRRIVIMEIMRLRDTEWWKKDDWQTKTFEQAAAAVCTRYDILGLMIDFDKIDKRLFRSTSYGKLFIENWADSIIQSHKALDSYIDYRRNTAVHQRDTVRTAYIHFTSLRDAAKRATRRSAAPATAASRQRDRRVCDQDDNEGDQMAVQPPDIRKEHAIETYKALTTTGVEAVKASLLLNGGSAIAFIAFWGNLLSKALPSTIPNFRPALICYGIGLFSAGVSLVLGYLLNLRVYDEAMRQKPEKHPWLLWPAFGLVITSYLAFVAGSIWAICVLPIVR